MLELMCIPKEKQLVPPPMIRIHTSPDSLSSTKDVWKVRGASKVTLGPLIKREIIQN